MSDTAQILHLTSGQGPASSAVGDVYRILASGAQTGGDYSVADRLRWRDSAARARVLPSGGPPPHIHRREDEAFFVPE